MPNTHLVHPNTHVKKKQKNAPHCCTSVQEACVRGNQVNWTCAFPSIKLASQSFSQDTLASELNKWNFKFHEVTLVCVWQMKQIQGLFTIWHFHLISCWAMEWQSVPEVAFIVVNNLVFQMLLLFITAFGRMACSTAAKNYLLLIRCSCLCDFIFEGVF